MSLPLSFDKTLTESGCIPAGSRVLVGVSGGADSVALLMLLHHVAPFRELGIEAAHLDHGLRPDSSDDARFVAQLCGRLGVPLTCEQANVAALARQRKGSLEEVARDVRRSFLLRVAEQRDCDLVALGHHADDQAETFLLQLLRGAGPAGLAGMRVVNGRVVRPLLAFHRRELISYLEREQVSWREDLSNQDQRFLRNRIRHELIPLLESINPQIRGQLAGSCERFRHDEVYWSALVARELPCCAQRENEVLVLDVPGLLSRPVALTSRLIRAALQEVRGDLRRITATHVASLLQLLNRGPVQGELSLPGVWAARRYDRLLLSRSHPAQTTYWEVDLPGPGRYPLPDGRSLEISAASHASGESADVVEFSARDLSFPLQLRAPMPGDRFQPSGMEGTKKLQDLFVDLKLPREERQRSAVLIKDTELLWVVGLRRCEGRRPGDGEAVLRLAVKGRIAS